VATKKAAATSKIEVGKDIEAQCGKCKANTEHTIVALVDGAAKRVTCKTCKAQHNYRKPKKTAAEKATKKKAAPRKSTRMTAEKKWAILVSSLESFEKAADYTMAGNYKENSLVKHPTFGVGAVIRIVDSSRAEMLFESGAKLMATNRK
jgi:hypothetical protein